MKKKISIGVVALVVLGLGFFLFKISPQTDQSGSLDQFNLSDIQPISEPRPVGPDDHIYGSLKAKNVMVVYEDYQCPACKTFVPILKKIPQELQDTKVVFRHFPLANIHKNAVYAALAAEAAGAQGQFWEITDYLYAAQEEWANLDDPTEKFVELAKKAGVGDLEKFRQDLTLRKYKSRVEQDLRESLALRLQGTPSIIFNSHELQLGDIESIKSQAQDYYVPVEK